MESRIISIDEANLMLPLLRQIVGDIMAHWERIITKRTQLECVEKGLDPTGSGSRPGDEELESGNLKCELNILIDKINSYIR